MHQLVGGARRNIVEISDENQWSLHIFQCRKKLFRFEYTSIFILIIKMRGYEADDAPVDVHFRANEAAPLGFAGVLVKSMVSRHDEKPRKDRNAVLPALI